MLRIATLCDATVPALSDALTALSDAMAEHGADFRRFVGAENLDTLAALLDPVADGLARYAGKLAAHEAEEIGDVATVEEV